MASAWSFLTLDPTDTQFAGNDGYDDRLDRYYSWDSTVPSHASVHSGDVALLRDAAHFLGFGRIADISTRTANSRKAFRTFWIPRIGLSATDPVW